MTTSMFNIYFSTGPVDLVHASFLCHGLLILTNLRYDAILLISFMMV